MKKGGLMNFIRNDLLNYFNKAKDGIEGTKDEKKRLEFVEYLKDTMQKICLTKKENDDEEENFHTNILPGRSL